MCTYESKKKKKKETVLGQQAVLNRCATITKALLFFTQKQVLGIVPSQ